MIGKVVTGQLQVVSDVKNCLDSRKSVFSPIITLSLELKMPWLIVGHMLGKDMRDTAILVRLKNPLLPFEKILCTSCQKCVDSTMCG